MEDESGEKSNIGTLWPKNIKVHYTKEIRKRWFKINQGDTVTVKEKDIHAILPCLVLKRGAHGFEKDVHVDLC